MSYYKMNEIFNHYFFGWEYYDEHSTEMNLWLSNARFQKVIHIKMRMRSNIYNFYYAILYIMLFINIAYIKNLFQVIIYFYLIDNN